MARAGTFFWLGDAMGVGGWMKSIGAFRPNGPNPHMLTGSDPFSYTYIQQDWNATRQGLLDKTAMYLIQVIPPLDNDTVWRVTGDYFPVMYFSYQLYDQVSGCSLSWTCVPALFLSERPCSLIVDQLERMHGNY